VTYSEHVISCDLELKLLLVTCCVEDSLVTEFGSVTCLEGLLRRYGRFVEYFVKWKKNVCLYAAYLDKFSTSRYLKPSRR
jgi:hypothetical protein